MSKIVLAFEGVIFFIGGWGIMVEGSLPVGMLVSFIGAIFVLIAMRDWKIV